MFFYQISRIFYRFLIIPWCDFIILDFVIIFSMTFAKNCVYSVKIYKEPSGLLYWKVN